MGKHYLEEKGGWEQRRSCPSEESNQESQTRDLRKMAHETPRVPVLEGDMHTDG